VLPSAEAKQGLKFITLPGVWIVTSRRKFDRFGDWFMFKILLPRPVKSGGPSQAGTRHLAIVASTISTGSVALPGWPQGLLPGLHIDGERNFHPDHLVGDEDMHFTDGDLLVNPVPPRSLSRDRHARPFVVERHDGERAVGW
jgi:hypothetical protein